ncbi:MAG TPA: UDP-galactopyranose mutase, partial [Thermoguttaceae bacterium]|nr:UDP-galactopyranose mutase [Thermoguttaceae bacterium]
MKYDYLIVGAGCAGAVLAERLANDLQRKVLLIDRRGHVGGNAYDRRDDDGLFVQPYGPHIFHTTDKTVWDYLSRFTEWNGYVHRVLAVVGDKTVPLPISLETMERLYGRAFTSEALREYFDRHRIQMDEIENARDVVVSQVGQELYELFFENYTRKQWGLEPEQLSAEVTRRLPVRFGRDTRYFADPYQGLPAHGFTAMFQRMLDSANITLRLNTDYRDVTDSERYDKLIYTGPIDEFFDYAYGPLPYRSLTFRFESLDVEQFQTVGVVNYPNDQEYTRITEFKHLYRQRHPKTTICYEYSSA